MTQGERSVPKFAAGLLARYDVLEPIGEGGTSIVYRARQKPHGTPVALKVLDSQTFDHEDALARFEEEAQVALRLEHPNLVRLLEYGRDPEMAWLAYELIEGIDLDQRIREAPEGARRGMRVEEALGVLRDVARGLAYAHKMGVVHRDLKPANILLETAGPARITDFGLARVLGAARAVKTRTGVVVGTPECMAPEQARGRPAGPAADVYAVGVLLYWMLAGRPPFVKDTPGEVMLAQVRDAPTPLVELRPRLPPGVYELVDRLLAKDPEARPSIEEVDRATKVVASLDESARDQVRSALSAPQIKVLSTARPGWPRWLAVGALAMVAALGVWWTAGDPGPPVEPESWSTPRRLRVRWRRAPGRLEVRPVDETEDWRGAEGRADPPGVFTAEVDGLRAGEEYVWRVMARRGMLQDRVRLPQAVGCAGPWPAYDAQGGAAGWLLAPSGPVLVLTGEGANAETLGDGLVRIPQGRYRLAFPGGLSEEGGEAGDPVPLEGAVEGLQAALMDLDVRSVLGAAVRRGEGGDPSRSARRAAIDVYGRLRGLEAALRGFLGGRSEAENLGFYLALARADAVDRALSNEGLPPAFGVQEPMRRCLAIAASPRVVHREEGRGLGLATEEARRNDPELRHFVPPRRPVPEGSGDLALRLALVDLPGHLVLEVEVGDRRFPVRPVARDFVFTGEVELILPEALAPAGSTVRIHLAAEDLPGAARGSGKLPIPLFGDRPLPAALREGPGTAWLEDLVLTRLPRRGGS